MASSCTEIEPSPRRPPKTCKDITLFSNLPLELRRKIWKAAAFILRLVDLWLEVVTPLHLRTADKRTHLAGIVSGAQQPVVLQICHESREEARRYYKEYILWPTKQKQTKERSRFKSRVYINPRVDTLWLPWLYEIFVYGASGDAAKSELVVNFMDLLNDLKPASLALNMWPGTIFDESISVFCENLLIMNAMENIKDFILCTGPLDRYKQPSLVVYEPDFTFTDLCDDGTKPSYCCIVGDYDDWVKKSLADKSEIGGSG